MSHYYAPDLRGNFMRWLFVKVHMFHYFDKFKNPGKYK